MQLTQRYLALDVFRGMDVALMIVVNSLGSQNTYSPLTHAAWDGFTLTDLVFPTFLFAVGNAMSFSLPRYEEKGEGAFLRKVLSRTAIIFLIGFLMYWFPFVRHGEMGWEMIPFSDTRVFGVLQRIALCYGIAALVIHYLKVRGALVFALFALIAYRFMLALGDLSMLGNVGTKVDLWLLGPGHMYHGEGVAFEPEGLLSTLPSTVNVIAGYVAGLYIQKSGKSYETIAKMLMVGVVLILAGVWWDLLFPINKKLWTSSYVLLTVGIGLCALAILVFIIDLAGRKNWTYFFEVFGRNTLFIYLLSELIIILLFAIPVGDGSLFGYTYRMGFQSWAGDLNGSPLFAMTIMLTCWIVGWLLDKNKIYIRI
jgi:predicted acyltransferase